MSAPKKLPQSAVLQAPAKYVTIPAAVARTSATPWYIRSRIWDGTLKAAKVGKRYLIEVESLERHFTELMT
jgi:hypothetical protein